MLWSQARRRTCSVWSTEQGPRIWGAPDFLQPGRIPSYGPGRRPNYGWSVVLLPEIENSSSRDRSPAVRSPPCPRVTVSRDEIDRFVPSAQDSRIFSPVPRSPPLGCSLVARRRPSAQVVRSPSARRPGSDSDGNSAPIFRLWRKFLPAAWSSRKKIVKVLNLELMNFVVQSNSKPACL
jgi:hypothetical protein